MDFKYKRPVITPCQIDKNLIPDESKQINVLIQMKNDNKSDYTINFTRKAKFPEQTHKPKRTRSSKSLYRQPTKPKRIQKKPMHSLQQILQILQDKLEHADLPPRIKGNQNPNKRKNRNAHSQRKKTNIN